MKYNYKYVSSFLILIFVVPFFIVACNDVQEHTKEKHQIDSLSSLAFKYYIQGNDSNCYQTLNDFSKYSNNDEILIRADLLKLEFDSYYHPETLAITADSVINIAK